jgi:hypothetical protein
MNKPRYAHECKACTYLGQHNDADLYFCGQGGIADTVIARYSDRGDDYHSGMAYAKSGTNPELSVAYQRAVELGLTNL